MNAKVQAIRSPYAVRSATVVAQAWLTGAMSGKQTIARTDSILPGQVLTAIRSRVGESSSFQSVCTRLNQLSIDANATVSLSAFASRIDAPIEYAEFLARRRGLLHDGGVSVRKAIADLRLRSNEYEFQSGLALKAVATDLENATEAPRGAVQTCASYLRLSATFTFSVKDVEAALRLEAALSTDPSDPISVSRACLERADDVLKYRLPDHRAEDDAARDLVQTALKGTSAAFVP